MQSQKTSFSIKNTSSNDLQLLNASLPINFNDSGIVIFVNEVHLLKANGLISLIDSGIVIFVNDVHYENSFHQYNLPQKI